MQKIDNFERTYYKVINYDTDEVIFEKAFTSEIVRKLGIRHDFYHNSKKGYYTHRKTSKNYTYIKLEDEKLNT